MPKRYAEVTAESEEYFRCLAFEWDIRAAKKLVAGRTPATGLSITEEGMRSLFGETPKTEADGTMRISIGLVGVDEERAMSEAIDPNVPVIGAMVRGMKNGEFFLTLDGHHRIFKAWKLGWTRVPMHLLTGDEEVALRTWRSVKPEKKKRRRAKMAA